LVQGRTYDYSGLPEKGQSPGLPPGLSWSGLKRLAAFLKRVVYVLDGLHAVTVELFRSCLEFMLGLLEMVDRCIDPRMMLGRRTCCGRHRRRRSCGGCGGLRRPRLRVKNQW
jgi:hypothetical protein